MTVEAPAFRASAVWITFGICLCVKIMLQPASRALWPCYTAASRNWWLGWSLYDRKVIFHDYRYSPTFAVVFTPFTWGPDWWATTLWGLFLLACLWLALQGLQREVLPLQWTPRPRETWLLLALVGMSHSLWSGQSNVLIVAGAVAASAAIARGKWWLAAALLVGPGWIKLWPFLFLLLCVVNWPRRLALPCLVWGLVGAGIPFLTQRPHYVFDEYIEWWNCIRNGPIATRLASYDAWRLWEALLPPVNERGYVALQITMAGVLVACALWMRRRGMETRLRLTVLLVSWSSWQLFLGRGVVKNTLSLLTPLSSWAFLRARELKRGQFLTGAGLLLTFAAIQINDTWITKLGAEWIRLLHPVGLLLLWGGILQSGMLQTGDNSTQDAE